MKSRFFSRVAMLPVAFVYSLCEEIQVEKKIETLKSDFEVLKLRYVPRLDNICRAIRAIRQSKLVTVRASPVSPTLA